MIVSLEWTQHIIRGMLVFTTFVHIYFLVGTDCARSQWFEVGGNTDIKNQGNTSTFQSTSRYPRYHHFLKFQSKWTDLLLRRVVAVTNTCIT